MLNALNVYKYIIYDNFENFHFYLDHMKTIADLLQSGALPYPVQINLCSR